MKNERHQEQLFPVRLRGAANIVCLLKDCAEQKDLGKGSRLHAHILEHNFLEQNCHVASSLVSMYAKCGALAKAQQVLDELPVRNVITWTTLITGYTNHGQAEEALKCFKNMQCEGHLPNAVTLICVLKACGSIRAAAEGEKIHEKIVKLHILETNIVLGNALVGMYAKCGVLIKAKQVLNELHVRDVITWNALIIGYVQQGQGEEALECFDSMQNEGHSPSAITFICVLKACGSIKAMARGQKIHDKIVSLGILENNVVLGNTLIDMYAKCGALAKAQQMVDDLPVQNVITWNALIGGYTHQGHSEEALKCFDTMQCEGYSANVITFTCALRACGNIGAAIKGQEIHDAIHCLGFLEENVVLRSALVDMYARCGALAKAQQVLDRFPVRNMVMWTALIAGYAQQGHAEEALKCFENMQQDGHFPDAVTFSCALKACGSIGAVAKGEMIHDKIVSLDMLKKDNVLGNSLVDMYAKCGALAKAQQVLNELPVRDIVTWNALLAAYVQQGQGDEALKCFEIMQQDGHTPDVVSFICALKACGSIGAVEKGQQIHDKIVSLGFLEKDVVVGCTLLDMYAKCGTLVQVMEVVAKLPFQNVVTFNASIGGYAQQGQYGKAFSCFQKMQAEGVQPDSTTLLGILTVCSHSGLLDHAEMHFLRMSIKYGIIQDSEHYCCMVDLFSRAGRFNNALLLIAQMPFADYVPVWLSLLGACRNWGDLKIGRLAFEHVRRLEKTDAAAYVCMSNSYIAAGMLEEAEEVEAMRMANGACEMLVDLCY